MNYIGEITMLKDGEHWTYPESDYGKAEVWYKHEVYFLFEIPQYGGVPKFVRAFHKKAVTEILDTIESWT